VVQKEVDAHALVVGFLHLGWRALVLEGWTVMGVATHVAGGSIAARIRPLS
jgi:hypothetical protein